jgi:hypothetical protein
LIHILILGKPPSITPSLDSPLLALARLIFVERGSGRRWPKAIARRLGLAGDEPGLPS